ncbi:MAG: YfhO family protein [Clostridia bacterium]|nr:YfhO family protein [Clostridia bacterium]
MPAFLEKVTFKISSLVERNRKTLLAFGIPALILLIGFFTRGVFPIADRNILTIDLYHQYAPFMAELQHKLKTGGSLFYSWSGGLGTNFYALFAYYLASPLNILVVLFPPSYLTEAILLLVVLKIGLAGACFFLFLRGVWHQENYFSVALACLYALSSYSLAYYWNIMWLDGIFLMPLILLGLVQLVREGRFWLYTLTLGLVIYSNYYIAFFVCLFTAFYFILLLFQYHRLSRPGAFFATVGRFIAFSILGAGLAAFLALPTYFSLKLTSAAGDAMPRTITHYFDLFDFIGQHFILTPPTIRDGMPNMYAGVALLVLIPMFFLAKSVPLKVKFLHFGLILILILSFNVNVLNFIWHGMHFPNQLPYRNSFVYIFLVLTMAYPALMSLREFSGKQIGGLCAAAMGVVLLAQKINDKTPELQTIYVTIIFLSIYAAVLTLDRIRQMNRQELALAFLFVVIAEMLTHTLLTLHRIDTTEYMSSRAGYLSGPQVDEIREQLKAIEKEEDGHFYRVEVVPPRTINDPFMYQYRGVSIFASTMQTKPVKMFENLGYHSNSINSYKYEASTLVLDSLFGLKYIIRRSGSPPYKLMPSILKTDQIEVFKNPYALSLGYVGNEELRGWRSSASDPFTAQNRLMKALCGVDNVLVPLQMEQAESDNITYTSNGNSHAFSFRKSNKDQEAIARVRIINEKDQHVYLYFDVSPNKAKRGYVMVGETKRDYNAKRATIIDLGHVSAGTEIVFNITFDEESDETGRFELYACALDEQAFTQAIDILRQNSLSINKMTDTRVSASIDAQKDGILMLTIPYDSGWHVTVDGNPVEIEALDDALICFPIQAGRHDIEMRYIPPWFFEGLMISIGSLLILLMIWKLPSWLKKKSKHTKQNNNKSCQVRPVSLEQPHTDPDHDQMPL